MSRLNLEPIVDKMAEDLKKACNPTNADMIRSMTDEQLADEMLKFPDVCEQAGFCKNDILCNDTLDRGEMIPEGMCRTCVMNWLKKEVNS